MESVEMQNKRISKYNVSRKIAIEQAEYIINKKLLNLSDEDSTLTRELIELIVSIAVSDVSIALYNSRRPSND